MDLTRRNFVKLGLTAGTTLAIEDSLGLFARAMELKLGGDGRLVDPSKDLTRGRRYDKVVPYTCLVCNIEDGGLAYIKNGRIEKLEGNPKHPSTRGRLCPKGNSGIYHVYDPDRILYPLKRTGPRGSGQWKRVSWDEAISEVAERIVDVLDNGHPNEIMFKFGRNRTGGVITRFMHTLGSNTISHHTAICESSKKVGMEPTWGPDIETPDFANTRYILNFGSNIMEAAYFMNPYSQRVVEGLAERGAKLVTFDVRLSNTAGRSHEWFPIFPGTDGIIALAMGNVILQEGLADEEFINDWTNVTVQELKDHYKQFTPEDAERASKGPFGEKGGISRHDIIRIAREFASVKPYCTTYSYRGPCKHAYGSYNEKCQMMLNILVGSVEKKGGYCLPRGMAYKQPEPVPPKPKDPSYLVSPPHYPLARHQVVQLIPFWIREGRAKVKIWFTYCDNPVYGHPGSEAVWGELLRDEELIPFIVSFSPFMSENTRLADLILPNAVYLERYEPESMPSSLWPWLGARQPVVKPMGEAQELRWTLKRIIDKVDPDGSRGMKKYWNFSSPEDYIRQQFEGIPGLKDVGGWQFIKKHGVWPIYGELNPATGKISDALGFEIKAEYGLHKKELSRAEMRGARVDRRTGTIYKNGKPIGVRIKGKNYVGFGTPTRKIHVKVEEWEKYGFNPMPVWKKEPWLWEMKPDEMVLTTFKWNVHTQSRTASVKWLAEIVHNNPAWINAETAMKKGIKDGDLIRITSGVGYMVTKARLTEGIHPRVIAVSTACGHWAYGRLATLKLKDSQPFWSKGQRIPVPARPGVGDDPDLKNVWWNDHGVQPNNIIPAIADPIGGSQAWFSTVVKVEKARPGDRYGDWKADPDKHYEFFKMGERFAYTGDMHRKMHPEVKIDWNKLPKPELKAGHE